MVCPSRSDGGDFDFTAARPVFWGDMTASAFDRRKSKMNVQRYSNKEGGGNKYHTIDGHEREKNENFDLQLGQKKIDVKKLLTRILFAQAKTTRHFKGKHNRPRANASDSFDWNWSSTFDRRRPTNLGR